jgi:hypothetical protein
MNTLIIRYLLIFLISFIIVSCDVDSPTSLLFNSPHCRIQQISDVEFPPYPKFPKMTITVINDGDGPTAMHVGCYVRLKNGNYILEDGIALFGTLYNGESRTDEIWFSGLEETDIINSKEITLYWYDAENNYYESSIY